MQKKLREFTARLLTLASQSPTRYLFALFLLAYGRFLVKYGYELVGAYHVDLPSFYTASQAAFKLGASPYTVKTLQALSADRVFPWLYPPPSLFLFYPLAWMNYEQAKLVFLAANHLIVLFLTWWMPLKLFKFSSPKNFGELALGVAAALLYYPFVDTLRMGQINLFLLLALVLFLYLAERERPIWAGLALAIAILLKTYPALLLPLLLAGKRYREAFFTTLWLAAIYLAGLLLLPWQFWSDWVTQVLPLGGYGTAPKGLSMDLNVNLNGFFSRLFIDTQWNQALIPHPLWGLTLTYLSALVIFALSLWVCFQVAHRKPSEGLRTVFVVGLLMVYLISPFSWEHHLVYLFPAILMLLFAQPGERHPAGAFGYLLLVGLAGAVIAMQGYLEIKFAAVLLLWGLAVWGGFRANFKLISTGAQGLA